MLIKGSNYYTKEINPKLYNSFNLAMKINSFKLVKPIHIQDLFKAIYSLQIIFWYILMLVYFVVGTLARWMAYIKINKPIYQGGKQFILPLFANYYSSF